MSSAFTDGAALVLGMLLVVAGALKLARPRGFGNAVARLLPKGPELRARRVVLRVAAPVVGTVEVLLGAGLLLSAHLPSGLATDVAIGVAGLYLGFLVVVAVAVRKGAACGCFDSFSDSAAGPAELARSIVLALLAVWVAGRVLGGHALDPFRVGSLGAAALVLAAVAAVVLVAGARWPGPLARRPAATGVAARFWSVMGPVTSRTEDIEPRSIEKVSPDLQRRAVDAARATPSARAFETWLGPRAADIDWAAASVSRVTNTIAGRPASGVLVTPPSTRGVSLMVSLPWDPPLLSDGVVIASVDGQPVSVLKSVVQVAGARPDGA